MRIHEAGLCDTGAVAVTVKVERSGLAVLEARADALVGDRVVAVESAHQLGAGLCEAVPRR